jgi:hypothetical protein
MAATTAKSTKAMAWPVVNKAAFPFSRRFKAAFGLTPARYGRLQEASPTSAANKRARTLTASRICSGENAV